MRFLTSLLPYWSWCQMWLCRHLRSLIYRSYESPLTTVWFVNQGGQLLNYVPLKSSSSIQVLQTAWLKLLSSAWFHLILCTFPRSCLKGMHHAASPVIFLSNVCIHFSALSLCKKKKMYHHCLTVRLSLAYANSSYCILIQHPCQQHSFCHLCLQCLFFNRL